MPPLPPVTVDVERQITAILHQAGEFLRNGDTPAAEREIDRALVAKPNDVRARNLLGLVRFRAGRHDEALQLYRDLVTEDREDASLRLNLGLVELRVGQHREAALNLQKVVEREPHNIRAYGYLGLALMRSGELVLAREALLRAGQAELVKQVESQMATDSSGLTNEPALAPAKETMSAASAEVRRIAERGLRELAEESPAESPLVDAGPPLLSPLPPARVEPAQPGGRAPLKMEGPMSIAQFVSSRLLQAGAEGRTFAIADGGFLVIRIDGRLPTRTVGAVASTGQLTFEPMARRVRGRVTDEAFGTGVEALFQTSGKGLIVASPRGGRFSAVALQDDVLYMRESALYAFEESLHWENGRIPGSAPSSEPVVQLRGTGQCALRTARATFCLQLTHGDSLYVSEESLLGWIGRIVPRQVKGSDEEPTPYIEATGEGTLILEEPAPERSAV